MSKYISFVGEFQENDNTPIITDEQIDNEWTEQDEENICNYHAWVNNTYRRLLRERRQQEQWEVLEEAYKDSLCVTVYRAPWNKPGWGVVVADCPDGGWIETAVVNLSSFVGGAAVPLGSEVRILE